MIAVSSAISVGGNAVKRYAARSPAVFIARPKTSTWLAFRQKSRSTRRKNRRARIEPKVNAARTAFTDHSAKLGVVACPMMLRRSATHPKIAAIHKAIAGVLPL